MFWLRHVQATSLSTRIVLILVTGLVLCQLLTSTIWFESRRRQMLEIPARVFATRVADSLRLLETASESERIGRLEALQTPGFSVRLSPAPPPSGGPSQDRSRTHRFFEEVIHLHLGRPAEIHVLTAQLLDEHDRPAGSWAMMSAREPMVSFRIAARLTPTDPWLIAEGREDENGADLDRTGTIIDYILRIYLLRIVIVTGLTLVAVRLAMTPLRRMADAAEALRRDINSPPLATDGPHEVRQAAEAFNAMQEEMIAHVEERTRFLAAVSHDLRSPITRLRLRTELLPTEELKASYRRDLSEMETMVDTTLAYVKGGVDSGIRAVIDVDAMLLDLVGNLAEQGLAVTLQGRAGGSISCYPETLRRCVQNLIDNALRYAGNAALFVFADSDQIRILVRDDGPGIADEQLELVFEPFYRLENSRNISSGGVGLGLSIARNIAAAHGGTLALSNRASGGLEVQLILPRDADIVLR